MDTQKFVKMARQTLNALGLPDVPVFVIDNAPMAEAMGLTVPASTTGDTAHILIPEKWLAHFTEDEAKDNLLHEAAHVLTTDTPDDETGHGAEWVKTAKRLGVRNPAGETDYSWNPTSDDIADLMIGEQMAKIFGPAVVAQA